MDVVVVTGWENITVFIQLDLHIWRTNRWTSEDVETRRLAAYLA